MNNNNSHDKEIKRNVCVVMSYGVLELTEKELKTYIVFLQNVYDDSRE